MRRDKFAEVLKYARSFTPKNPALHSFSRDEPAAGTRAGTMKFEEKLAASMRRSWEEHYIDYKVCSAR